MTQGRLPEETLSVTINPSWEPRITSGFPKAGITCFGGSQSSLRRSVSVRF